MLFLVLLPRRVEVIKAERLFGQADVQVRFSHWCRFNNLFWQAGFVSILAGRVTWKPLSRGFNLPHGFEDISLWVPRQDTYKCGWSLRKLFQYYSSPSPLTHIPSVVVQHEQYFINTLSIQCFWSPETSVNWKVKFLMETAILDVTVKGGWRWNIMRFSFKWKP